jgi:hypothetical protein
VKPPLIRVNLSCTLIIENTSLLTQDSDSLLDFSEISSNGFRTALFTPINPENAGGYNNETCPQTQLKAAALRLHCAWADPSRRSLGCWGPQPLRVPAEMVLDKCRNKEV